MRHVVRIVVVVVVLALAQLGVVHAGFVSFGGGGSVWNVTITYCTNGFSVSGSGGAGGAGVTSSLVVTASSIPTSTALPATVASGVGTAVGVPVISGSSTFFYSSPQTPGTPASVTIRRLDNGVDVFPSPATDNDTIQSCTVGGGNAVTFFVPGDSRINGFAGDHVAVYCNLNTTGAMAQTVDIWGMDSLGRGFRLGLFNYADILAAGAKGLSRNLGSNGTVFVMVDSTGRYFYAGWMGGSYNATGQGDFTKTFTCLFPKP